jgi:soluble lytic murein transglycosylase-like protein
MRGASHGLTFALLLGAVVAVSPTLAQSPRNVIDGNGSHLDGLIAKHAAAHNLPESLVRRVIKRESGGNPRAISKGNYGLMQIRLGTARGMGYRGGVAGLLDADTNMTYAVKYLAGAYKVADGNPDRAVRYYAAGYYYVAKRRGMAMPAAEPAAVSAAVSEAQLSARADANDEAADVLVPAESVSAGDAAIVSSH